MEKHQFGCFPENVCHLKGRNTKFGQNLVKRIQDESEAYLEPSRISAMERFCKNNKRLSAINYFRKKVSS